MNSKSRILVTGGTGLVGAPIVRRLAQSGYEITAISRYPIVTALKHRNVRWICGDLKDSAEKLLTDVGKVDYVVHAAALVHDLSDVMSLNDLACTNISASQSLFHWCSVTNVKRVIFVSSLSVLRHPLTPPITETHAIGPSTPYAMSKLWGEELLFRHASESNFTPIVLRISSPVPIKFDDLPANVVRKWIEAAENGDTIRVFGSGRRAQDFVACSDIATAVLQSVESAIANGVYHIGSGTTIRMIDLAELIAKGKSTTISFEGSDSSEHDRWVLSLERAKDELNYVPEYSGRAAIQMLVEGSL